MIDIALSMETGSGRTMHIWPGRKGSDVTN